MKPEIGLIFIHNKLKISKIEVNTGPDSMKNRSLKCGKKYGFPFYLNT